MTPLPSAVSAAVIPMFLSPSRFDDLAKCRLSVLAPAGVPGTLPVAPSALLGTLLHHVAREVAEGRWGQSTSPRAAFDAILGQAVAGLPLESVPLDQAVGRQRWFARMARARLWALEDAPSESLGDPRPLRQTAGAIGGPTEARADLGHEAWIVWPDGRLRGRADLVEPIPGGRRVVENKSGRTDDREGSLLDGIGLQVGLYALAIENVAGGSVQTVIRGDERIAIPWDATTRQRIRAHLEHTLAELPAGKEIRADALASPGPHCARCRLRPACRSYLGAAGLWTTERTAGRMPLDVWGELLRSTVTERGVRVELRDAVGRLAVITGLSPDWNVQRCASGTRLYFFDLETDEDRQHAERVQPTNFRERPPRAGSPRRPAFRLRVYEG